MESTKEVNRFLLRTTFFLDPLMTKSVTVGVCRDKGVGVIFSSAKRPNPLIFPFHIFYQLAIHFVNIKSHLEGDATFSPPPPTLDSGESIGIKRIFGKYYVKLGDDKKQSVLLNESEYAQFYRYLPQVNNRVTELFSREVAITSFVKDILSGDTFKAPPDLCPYLVNRILEEVTLNP